MKKIILVGYMGSGKSTIGKLLAHKINFSFYDLDSCIEIDQDLTISEIFEQKGELYFRKLENDYLTKILSKNENFVLSLGGGTPCYYNNHEILNNQDIFSVYLKASITTIFERLVTESSKRPILANLNADEKKEFIAKHLFERSYFYTNSKFSVTVDGKAPNEVVAEIEKLLL